MNLGDKINDLMTVFNFLTNSSQLAGAVGGESKKSAKGSGDGKPDESKKIGALARFTLEDEKVWGELLIALDSSERDSIRVLLENMPPYGDGVIYSKLRQQARIQFRLVVTGMLCEQSTQTVEVVSKVVRDRNERTTTKKYTKTTPTTDKRIDFLKSIAAMVGTKTSRSDLEPIYKDLENGGITPGDYTEIIKKGDAILTSTSDISLKIIKISILMILVSVTCGAIALYAISKY